MINIAVIGAGGWGKNHLRTFDKQPDCELLACCDLNDKNLINAQKNYPRIITTQSAEEIFENNQVDAISIASTSPTHYELGKAALLAGKHVMIEKPVTLNSKEASELVKIAEQSNLVLMVGHLLIYHPAVKMLKNIVNSGDIGDIYYLYAQRVNLGKIRSNENALWSFAPHDISVILYLFGSSPKTVTATGECYLQQNIQDVVFTTLHFPDNRMAHIHLSWLDPHKERKITLVGSKKMAVFDDMSANEKIRIYDKGAEVPGKMLSYQESVTLRNGNIYIPHLQMQEPLSLECSHFISCIKKGERPLTDGYNGLEVVKVLEAAQCSLEKGGQPVELETF